MNSYPRETTEYITANLYDGSTHITNNVQFSVVPAGQRPGVWVPAEIIQGNTVYLINSMTPGNYTIWSRVAVTDSEEIPVTELGSFRIN